jgi:putative transposase
MSTDEHLMVSAAHCTGWRHIGLYKDRFLCPAVSAELAGETIPLRDIIRVRNQRRRELSSILHDRQQVVDALLQLKRGTAPKEISAKAAVAPISEVRIKRYRNE